MVLLLALEADGTPMRVRTALQLINQALDDDPADETGEDPEDDPEDEADATVPDVPAAVLARAREEFAEHLQRGDVPGVRRIRRALRCGQPRAQQVRAYLEDLVQP